MKRRDNIPKNAILIDRQMFEDIVEPLHKIALDANVPDMVGGALFELDDPEDPNSDYKRPDISSMWFGWLLACRAIRGQVEQRMTPEATIEAIVAAHKLKDEVEAACVPVKH